MYPPRPPPSALLPRQGAMDSESQVQTDYDPERQQHLYSRQQLMTRISTFLFHDDQLLPVSNDASTLSPRSADTNPLRSNTANGSQAARPRTRDPNQLQSKNGPSTADGQDERARGDEKQGKVGRRRWVINHYKERHQNRIRELKTKLEAMYPEDGSPVVLLCWGEESASSILPVPVSSSGDEVAIWEALNKAWYTRRGYWRKFLPGLCVTRVDVVEISILGLKTTPENREGNEYIGMYTAIDIPSERRRLQNTIDINTPVEPCPYDRYTGSVECCCPDSSPASDKFEPCISRVNIDAKRKLSHLCTLNLMKHIFCDPNLAAPNDFLEKEGLVYSQRDISSQLDSRQTWHCPELRELKFKGIAISEGWALNTRWIKLQFVVITSLGVVVAAKSLFSWDTAWSVGTFFVELMGLLSQ